MRPAVLTAALALAAFSGSAMAQGAAYNRALASDVQYGPSSSGAGYQISGEVLYESSSPELVDLSYVVTVMVNGAVVGAPWPVDLVMTTAGECRSFCASQCRGGVCFGNNFFCVCINIFARPGSTSGEFEIEVPELRDGDAVTVRVSAVPDSFPEIDTSDDQVTIVIGNPPCRADFNGDGSVNSADFFAFLQSFFVFDASADFNQDGGVNSQDFFDFLGAFFEGC